jgi:hypothetical protein
MSDDFVNQLTLNCLISKNQLLKLNKKTKETTEQVKIKQMKEYEERLKILFNDLLVHQTPNDLLLDVRTAFEHFVEKSIYYFQAHDNNNNNNEDIKVIKEDIDFKDEEDVEEDLEQDLEEEEEEQDVEEQDVEEENLVEDLEEEEEPKIVNKKYKAMKSQGVENIQQLPLDWFQRIRVKK